MKGLIKYMLCAAFAVGATSCADDYLDTAPQSSTTKNDLFASPEAAQYAVNGLGRLMAKQYLESQGKNGEGTIYAYIGEWIGDGVQKLSYSGFVNTINLNYCQSLNNANMQFGWYYYYRIIGNVNQILENTPLESSGSLQKEWDYIRAQALTYRAYSYTMLSQIFSRRWTDRDGQSRGVVIRLDTSKDPLPCSSLAQVFEQVYKDLDEALDLFESCGKKRSTAVDMRWMADANVVHAIYSRAALIRNDWNTVIKHSQAAREGFSIMGPDEYMAGFNTANKEWIWEVFEDDTQPLYYYSFFNYIGSNCAGSVSRTNPSCISKQIVDPIDPSDKRLACFMIPTPEEIEADGGIDKISGSGNVTKGGFYNRVKADFAHRLYSTTKIGYYIGSKFLVKSGVGDGCYPIFRVAEMLYNEAEAQLRLGHETEAKALLEEATQPYQEGYTCTATGDELWAELKALRKFDLWAEGHSWFDLKRWGDSMVRLTWKEGGSWATYFAGDGTNGQSGGNYGPTDKNNWCIVIPQMETNYNNLVIAQEDPNWKPGTDF